MFRRTSPSMRERTKTIPLDLEQPIGVIEMALCRVSGLRVIERQEPSGPPCPVARATASDADEGILVVRPGRLPNARLHKSAGLRRDETSNANPPNGLDGMQLRRLSRGDRKTAGGEMGILERACAQTLPCVGGVSRGLGLVRDITGAAKGGNALRG
jgi:hypothetical protein